jgi:hypothetical protein
MIGTVVNGHVRMRPVVDGRVLAAPVYMDLSYRRGAAYEVRISDCGPDPVEWVFARDLLAIALQGGGEPAGLDCVRVRLACVSHDPLLVMTFEWAGDRRSFAASPPPVSRFLARTYDLVPPGDEARFTAVPETPAELLGTRTNP